MVYSFGIDSGARRDRGRFLANCFSPTPATEGLFVRGRWVKHSGIVEGKRSEGWKSYGFRTKRARERERATVSVVPDWKRTDRDTSVPTSRHDFIPVVIIVFAVHHRLQDQSRKKNIYFRSRITQILERLYYKIALQVTERGYRMVGITMEN